MKSWPNQTFFFIIWIFVHCDSIQTLVVSHSFRYNTYSDCMQSNIEHHTCAAMCVRAVCILYLISVTCILYSQFPINLVMFDENFSLFSLPLKYYYWILFRVSMISISIHTYVFISCMFYTCLNTIIIISFNQRILNIEYKKLFTHKHEMIYFFFLFSTSIQNYSRLRWTMKSKNHLGTEMSFIIKYYLFLEKKNAEYSVYLPLTFFK